jgi:hypothetical protein
MTNYDKYLDGTLGLLNDSHKLDLICPSNKYKRWALFTPISCFPPPPHAEDGSQGITHGSQACSSPLSYTPSSVCPI